jgi:hypothetical protein
MTKIEQNKQHIINLWNKVNRNGVDKLINWLNESDFFMAPASKKNHLNYPGGLAEHSLNVYECLKKKNEQFDSKYSEETITIVSLSHDFCKIDFYKINIEQITPAQTPYLRDISKADWEIYQEMIEKKILSKNLASDLIRFYKGETKIKPDLNRVDYKIEDDFPLGHGEKSLYLVSKFIELTEEEALAIRWHMGNYDVGYANILGYAIKKSPLVTLMITTDFEVSNILEKEEI